MQQWNSSSLNDWYCHRRGCEVAHVNRAGMAEKLRINCVHFNSYVWVVAFLLDSVALLLPLSEDQWLKQSNQGESYSEFWDKSCFLMDISKETFIPNYYWQLSYDLLSIVNRRVKNQKCLGLHNH